MDETFKPPVGGEKQADPEPTSQDLAKVCCEVLSAEDCAELAEMPIDDALGYAFTLLIEAGIDDPESVLKNVRILE